MEVLIRMDSVLLIIIPGALIVHLYKTNTLLTLLKVHLRFRSLDNFGENLSFAQIVRFD